MSIEPVRPDVDREDSSRLDSMLESLQKLCSEAGAHACATIDCDDLPFVEGAAGPQDVPAEEKSIFWPLPRFPRDSIEDALRQFSKAVVFRLDPDAGEPRAAAMKKIYDIASRVESACFYGGYHLAIGLAAGNCKEVFCSGDKKCQALTMGKPCRYPLRSRPSLEACGLDREAIAARAGWEDVESDVLLMGMVFVT